jgi:hypothetical protein
MNVLFFLSDLRKKAKDLLDACAEASEQECMFSKALATMTSQDGEPLRTPMINLENTVIDTATSGLSEGMVYITTWQVDGK